MKSLPLRLHVRPPRLNEFALEERSDEPLARYRANYLNYGSYYRIADKLG